MSSPHIEISLIQPVFPKNQPYFEFPKLGCEWIIILTISLPIINHENLLVPCGPIL